MKEKKVIVGIDVSKLTLDVCVLAQGETESFVIENRKAPIGRFFRKLHKEHDGARILVAMENTGLYNWATTTFRFSNLPSVICTRTM